MIANDWLYANWHPSCSVSKQVKTLLTTRVGGVSRNQQATDDYAGSLLVGACDGLNLGDNTADVPSAIQENQRRLVAQIGLPVQWLRQVHGTGVLRLPLQSGVVGTGTALQQPEADAVFTTERNVVCAVRTADCLPVLFADVRGASSGAVPRVVAAAHAGWRGLAAGVLQSTLAAMQAAVPELEPADLAVYLGPAISAEVFEVGEEVRQVFLTHNPAWACAFTPARAQQPQAANKWYADLYWLARATLVEAGVVMISQGDFCTMQDSARFYSYRRNPNTGRMASCIWIESD